VAKLYEELKRRKVFRVAAVYAVVAWLLIEVADTVLPTFGAPVWINQTLIFLLVIGFPVAVILAWAYEVTPEGIRPDNQVQASSGLQVTSVQPINYVILLIVLLVAGFQIADRFLMNTQPLANLSSRGPTITDVVRFSMPIGEGRSLYLGGKDALFGRPAATSLAFSNDGRLLVYAGWEPGSQGSRSQLYLRPLDQEQAQPVDGTVGGSSPFLSPDNNWIGFYVDNTLRRIPITGGIAQTIVASTGSDLFSMENYGASWGDINRIVYADSVPGTARIGLFLAEATGDSGVLLADPGESQGQFNRYTQPHMLPGAEGVLFQGMAGNNDPERAEVLVLEFASGTQTSLLRNAMNPRYVAETGTLLFMRQGLLMEVGFDHKTLTLMGEPVVIAENVMQALNMGNPLYSTGVGQLAISAAGHLVYARGGVTPAVRTSLIRVTLDGLAEPLSSISQSQPRAVFLRLSPDGTRLAYQSASAEGFSVHVHDLVRNVSLRMNGEGVFPAWSPDSESLLMSSGREDNVINVYRLRVDGSDERPERLVPSDQGQVMQSVSVDGVIAWQQNGDIWTLAPGAEPAPFFTSDAQEDYATFSNDGRWLAYLSVTSTNSGDLYVRPYPGPGRAILIASGSYSESAWSRDGKQLYFLESNPDTSTIRMMVTEIKDGVPSPVRPLIDPWPYILTARGRNFDVLEDGSFITSINSSQTNNNTSAQIAQADEMAVSELQVVFNFFELLRRQ
jgi:hypothetical protein